LHYFSPHDNNLQSVTCLSCLICRMWSPIIKNWYIYIYIFYTNFLTEFYLYFRLMRICQSRIIIFPFCLAYLVWFFFFVCNVSLFRMWSKHLSICNICENTAWWNSIIVLEKLWLMGKFLLQKSKEYIFLYHALLLVYFLRRSTCYGWGHK
jgi:hypothetical protein